MAEKPASQDLSQAFVGLFNSASLDALYEKTIDATLSGFGRDVVFYLTPAKSLPVNNAPTYNPFGGVGGQDPRLDTSSEVTGNKGYIVTPITVTYRAHIKHGPVQFNQDAPFTLNENEVALTTVYGAFDDINDAVEANIDGQMFVSLKGARPIGFSTKKYIISFWKRKVNPGVVS